jgi:hypothetical protein
MATMEMESASTWNPIVFRGRALDMRTKRFNGESYGLPRKFRLWQEGQNVSDGLGYSGIAHAVFNAQGRERFPAKVMPHSQSVVSL